MKPSERIIGELTEFKNQTMHRLDKMDAKIDKLSSFKMKAVGVVAALMFLITIGVEAVARSR